MLMIMQGMMPIMARQVSEDKSLQNIVLRYLVLVSESNVFAKSQRTEPKSRLALIVSISACLIEQS